jgi:hypothetical protein
MTTAGTTAVNIDTSNKLSAALPVFPGRRLGESDLLTNAVGRLEAVVIRDLPTEARPARFSAF